MIWSSDQLLGPNACLCPTKLSDKALARSLWKDTAELWFSRAHCSCTDWWEVYYQTDRSLKITEYYSQAPKHPHDSGPEDVWGLDLKHKKNSSITKHKKNTNEPETRDEDRETHTHTAVTVRNTTRWAAQSLALSKGPKRQLDDSNLRGINKDFLLTLKMWKVSQSLDKWL